MMAPEKSGHLSSIYLIYVKLMCIHWTRHVTPGSEKQGPTIRIEVGSDAKYVYM